MLLLAACLLALCGMAAPALGQAPSPGTLIDNQAELSFVDPATFVAKDLLSNRVWVEVIGGPRVRLEQSQSRSYAPGSSFTFPHVLTNTGNAAGTYTITPALRPGSSVTLRNLQIVVDLNGNGVIDPGEPVLPLASLDVVLQPSEQWHFIVSGFIDAYLPPEAQPVEELQFDLRAQIAENARYADNVDTLQVMAGGGDGALQLHKSVNPTVSAPGNTVVYTIVGSNTAVAALEPHRIVVDGTQVSKFIIRDRLPPNTVFVEWVQTSSAQPLYHLAGDAQHVYQSAQPADLTTVSAVAWAFDHPLKAGDSFALSFRARVGPMASGQIENTAFAYFRQNNRNESAQSNVSIVTVPTQPARIDYYNNDRFEQIIPATHLGRDLYVQVAAGSCNVDPDRIEQISVRVTSQLTGDEEVFIATETGANTGIFRIMPAIPTQDASIDPVRKGDGILQTLVNDTLLAEVTDCIGATVDTQILIDPAGVVYDSRTNQPLAGVQVRLVDVTGQGNGGNPGGDAVVFDLDGAPAPATVVTTNNGEFHFPMVAQSTYRLEIIPTQDYSFPSAIPPGGQPAGRRIHPQGSYGGHFPVNITTGAVFLDVPLDTTSGNGMTLEKEASREVAEVGDSVIYTLTLSNTSGAPFNYTFIEDYLPVGFRYEPGTTARDGVKVADPEGGVGPTLRFPVGTLADQEQTVFTFRVRLTPGAEKGDGVNRAQATSYGPPVLVSNMAQAQVRPRPGIFDPRGIIIGTVFVDANNNGIQDPGEPGVPGVRLILEDGTYAITDSQGKYSIYGQRALTHVLKVDPYSLPAGAKLGGDSPRFALDPGSRFVDMKRYELHKANFMLVEPTEELYALIRQRVEQAQKWTPEFVSALDSTFTAEGPRQAVSDIRGRDAAGVVGSGRQLPEAFESILPEGTLTAGNSSLPPTPTAAVPLVDLELLVQSIQTPELGFIGLKDGDTVPYSQATIRLVGRAETRLELLVNGEPAPAARIGKVVEQAQPPLQAVEYIALQLKPGVNTLEAVEYDLFGNERDRKTITVTAPDRMAQMEVTFSTLSPVADGRTPVEVYVQVTDQYGTPVTASIPLTLETSLGSWDAEDRDRVTPGTQVFLEGGRAVYRLLPPLEPGEASIVISSGTMQSKQKLAFVPELRPMIATGIIEGRLSLNKLSSNQILPTSPEDAFEESLRAVAGIGEDGQAAGRAAFYLKGKIKGDMLLTIAYDSNKRQEEMELFRDIDPNAFYPVYGDDSIKGYDAQSSGKLYVRIDKNRSFALLGDFTTRGNNTEVRQLGEYNRSFNGIRLHHENAHFSGDFWITDDSTTQGINEFQANGTSGPFYIGSVDIVLNSETVEILTRDRDQPAVVLKTRTLSRNTDYDFDPFSGRLLLRRPVPSVDEEFNPQFIRITYEIQRGSGPKFLTYGANAQFKLNEYLEVGGSFARDEHPTEYYDLQSVNTTLKLADGTYLIAEGARSQSFDQGTGLAGRLDLRHQSNDTEARIFYGVTENTFKNPSSQLNSGRIEGGLKVTHDLAANTQLIAEGVYTEDKNSSGNRHGVRLDVAHKLDNQVKVTVGGRVSDETAISADPSLPPRQSLRVRSVRLRLDTPVPEVPLATVFGEYEQDIFKASQRVLAGGGHYQVSTKTRMYARHEFISSLGGPFELDTQGSSQRNNTIFGLETDYMKDGQLTNEYRVRNGIEGRQAEAATGLRNLWAISEGFRINTTFERITPFRSVTNNQSTAATVGFEYTRPETWKLTSRVEGRWADTNNSYLNTIGYAQKISDEWTFLGRSIFNAQLAKGSTATDLYQGRLLTGLAWRQSQKDEWNALFRYEYKYEQGVASLGSVDLQRHVHILASSVNYQPNSQWIFSGHYATKLVQESGAGLPSTSYMAHILAGRVMFEINERWDAGLSLATTFSNRLDNVQYAVGPEIGYVVSRNVRIGLGYNIVGFDDRDFDTAATSQGVFLSLRIKFDENLLKWAKFD